MYATCINPARFAPAMSSSSDNGAPDVAAMVHQIMGASLQHARAAGAHASPDEVRQAPASLAHEFCMQLDEFLSILVATFHDRPMLVPWHEIFKSEFLGVPEKEEYAIKRWDYEMRVDSEGYARDPSLYALLDEAVNMDKVHVQPDGSMVLDDGAIDAGKMSLVLSSGVFVFEAIDARSMFFDPDLDDEDRVALAVRVQQINSRALLFASIPAEMREVLSDVAQAADPSQPLTPETATHMLQSVIGCDLNELQSRPDRAEHLLSWATSLAGSLTSQEGMRALTSLVDEKGAQDATGVDVRSLLSNMQSQMGAVTALLHRAQDPQEEEEADETERVIAALEAGSGAGPSAGAGGSA